MSEDMVKDGYEDIVNIDISSVAIDMMRRKCQHMPQLKCILTLRKITLLKYAFFWIVCAMQSFGSFFLYEP